MSDHHKLLRRLGETLPPRVRAWGRRWVNTLAYDQAVAEQDDPYAHDPREFQSPKSPVTFGIVRERFHYHKSYIAACREMGLSYKLLDLFSNDWMRIVEESGCDAFLVWPSVNTTVWKEMFDDRLRIMEQQLGKIVYPTCNETWLYENKRRTHEWLAANHIPQPKTWVFYELEEARAFATDVPLPVVFKTSLGGSSRGVRILRRRHDVVRVVEEAFFRGIVPDRFYALDRQWGSAYFQEYLPDVHEWRMIRIGSSYFGYRKGRVADFHSGTQIKEWVEPPREYLDMVRRITDRGRFTSMNVDLFVTQDSRVLVNELHTVFGQSTVEQMRIGGKPGRYMYCEADDAWRFEEGDFARNGCANARIEYLLQNVLKHG